MSADINPNAHHTDTQNARIYEFLKRGNRITGLQALQLFGCIHLPRRIKDIKDSVSRPTILDQWIEIEGPEGSKPKRVKEYYLAPVDQN